MFSRPTDPRVLTEEAGWFSMVKAVEGTDDEEDEEDDEDEDEDEEADVDVEERATAA